MERSPRPLALVRFSPPPVPDGTESPYPFSVGETLVFLGEIPNMPGHCVVARHLGGTVHSGYHTENFVELDQDEV